MYCVAGKGVRRKIEHICRNPVRKGLVANEDGRLWLRRERVEGEETE